MFGTVVREWGYGGSQGTLLWPGGSGIAPTFTDRSPGDGPKKIAEEVGERRHSLCPGRHVGIWFVSSSSLTLIVKEGLVSSVPVNHVCNSHKVTCMLLCSSRRVGGMTPLRSWHTRIIAVWEVHLSSLSLRTLAPSPSFSYSPPSVLIVCSWIFRYLVEQAVCDRKFPCLQMLPNSGKYLLCRSSGLSWWFYFDH